MLDELMLVIFIVRLLNMMIYFEANGSDLFILFITCCFEYGLGFLDFGFETIPVCGAGGGGELAKAQVGVVFALEDGPMVGRGDVLGADMFGGFLLERHASFYPGTADGGEVLGIVGAAELVEDDATALETHGIVDDREADEMVEEKVEEVGVLEDEQTGDVLPGLGVVVEVEEA